MRRARTLVVVALLGVFAVVTMGADSCGTTDTKTNAEPADTSGSASSNDGGGGSSKAAGIGDTITLRGSDGLKMRVTLAGYQKHATTGEFDTTEHGKKLVGVDLVMKNVSGTQYDDSPSNGAALILDDDSQADASITVDGSCNVPGGVKIAPGGKRRICIPFEIGKHRRGKTFQLTLDSGFGQDAGEWKLH